MSRTIYYIGAGASRGKRDDKGNILEGVPVVSEIPNEFAAFREFINNAVVPDGYTTFLGLYHTSANDVQNCKLMMLSDIDRLQQGIIEHATIDTYARKLYLTNCFTEFKTLKDILCSFFVWSQLEHKVDGRYDTFFANILDERTLALPSDISIISWNYDSQIESAYKAYRNNPGLPIFEKNIQGEWPSLPKSGRVFKINGTASFLDGSVVERIKESESKTVAAVQLILFYNSSRADTSSMGFQMRTHLSFAWEPAVNHDKLMNALAVTTADAEQVVVIGYSFPFFNREMDRAILKGMPKLQKIYIQDIDASMVLQSIKAVLPDDRSVEIVLIDKCNQFYLPSEL